MSEPRYRVIMSYSFDDLAREVNMAIEAGYEPLGGVSATFDGDDDSYLLQALYKPKRELMFLTAEGPVMAKNLHVLKEASDE